MASEAGRALLADLNTEIRRAADQFDAAPPAWLWLFRCECADPACEAQVELTLERYDALRATEQPVLLAGHTLGRAEGARRRAQRLCDDAAALSAKAAHQVRRARRNAGEEG